MKPKEKLINCHIHLTCFTFSRILAMTTSLVVFSQLVIFSKLNKTSSMGNNKTNYSR